MNFSDLQEECWKNLGYPDPNSDRTNALLQTIRDSLNGAMDDVAATCAPSLDRLTREATIDVVAGTQDYQLGDWVQRPLSMWTEGQYAHPIYFRRALAADRDGSRNSVYVVGSLGPFQAALLPRTQPGDNLNGAAGASTGATATAGTTTVTFGASSTVLTSAVVGKMLRLNGEYADYKILSKDSDHVVTVDRPIITRVSGLGSTAGTGYSSVRWEISPPGRFKIRFLPNPTAAATVYYRYMAYPRKMLNASDEPELQEDMHLILVDGAMKRIAKIKQNAELYGMYGNDYQRFIENLKRSDVDDYSTDDTNQVETLRNMPGSRQIRQPGEYRRGGSGWAY